MVRRSHLTRTTQIFALTLSALFPLHIQQYYSELHVEYPEKVASTKATYWKSWVAVKNSDPVASAGRQNMQSAVTRAQ
jgi:hypothetical protein